MGVSGQRNAPASLYPREKDPRYPLWIQEAGWAPKPFWTQRLEEKSFAPAGDRTSIARSSSPYPDTILTKLPRLRGFILRVHNLANNVHFAAT
jgi:hypothetical protein